MTADNSDHHVSHLLSLPTELRLRIYSFLWTLEAEIVDLEQTSLDPAILGTCRLIRNEAETLYKHAQRALWSRAMYLSSTEGQLIFVPSDDL